jgi:tetratricopeptide (TPR) repeat protein
VNWDEVAAGGWADNNAFAALSHEDKLREIDEALGWALGRQDLQLQGRNRVAGAALQLMDAYGLDDARSRAWLTLALGSSTMHLGDRADALAILGELIDRPPLPEIAEAQKGAKVDYAGLILQTDPDRAEGLLRSVMAAPLEPDSPILAPGPTAAAMLGSLLRRKGDTEEALRVYEKGIIDAEAAGNPLLGPVMARLHGNLGNLLSGDLGRYQEAADHYARAVALFEAAGELQNASRRYFHQVHSLLSAGNHDAALRLLRAGAERIAGDPESFCAAIESADWLAAPDLAAWEAFFTTVLDRHPDEVTDAGQAVLAAARVVLRHRLGDDFGAIMLARDLRLGLLEGSSLFDALRDSVRQLAEAHDCYGIRWPLLQGSKNALDILELVKCRFVAELATVWLLKKAQLAVDPGWQDNDLLGELSGAAVVYGAGSVPAEPPGWLGPVTARVRAEFTRLRGLYPGADELVAEYRANFGPSIDPHGRVIPGSEDRLRRAIRAADLVGIPGTQIISRRALALCVSQRSEDPARGRREEFSDILNTALSIASGLAERQVAVHLSLATLLKENVTDDESTRLAAAIDHASRGLEIAEEHGLNALVAACALTLGNALMEYGAASLDNLRAAESALERALAAFRADPESAAHLDESSILNSLGGVNFRLGEKEEPEKRFAAAIGYLGMALRLRDEEGENEPRFRTMGNLVSVRMKYAELLNRPPGRDDIDLANRVLQLAPRVRNLELRGLTLANVSLVYKKAAHWAEARNAALQAVALSRGFGPSLPLIASLINAGSIQLESGDAAAARDLLEEAVATIEAFRMANDESRYRAELTERFDNAYRYLERALESLAAAAADRWWAVERATGRTLLEGMRHRDIDAEQRGVMRRLVQLPAGTVVIAAYLNSRGEFTCFILDARQGQLRIRPARTTVDVRELAVGAGGSFDDRLAWLPIYTPAHPAEFGRQMSWIGSRFLGPVLAEIDLAEVTRVVFISRNWAYLPWHAVPVPPDGAPLARAFEVVSVPSAVTLAHLLGGAQPDLARAAFVACDPSRRLKEHIEECRQSFALLDVRDKVVLTDSSRTVTRQAVSDLFGEIDVLHFAGHSVLAPGHPEKSGLVLSDGLFTVPEMEKALRQHAPALVFLSSCDSGAADSALRDAATLSSVFLQAGARVVIGACWPVADYVAALTARRFYQALGRTDAVAALKIVQAELMDTIPGAGWASFRLQGWT